ncbi:MAG TPA: hypothetical protein PKH24_20735 [Sedimentisphaerales bacterium]|nr:hypothetical protein [Sedimentisphaerales bacterium]HNU31629.1 hypothetical protein [Sedimentisphaerales bacterium]
MLRWTTRVVLVLVLLIVAAATVVHCVLKSDWLRRTLLTAASERTGMEVAVESLSVRWGGRTTLVGPLIKDPLTDDVILSADRIEISHAAIPLLILGRAARVQSVQVDNPTVHLRRDEHGRWNAEDAWTRLAMSLGDSDRTTGPTVLPRIAIHNAMIQIAEPNGATETAGPLDFRGAPEGPRLWQFDVNLSPVAEMKGRTVQGGDWSHGVSFVIADIESWVRRVLGRGAAPIQAAGRWEGKVLRDTVAGTLRLDTMTLGPLTARGGICLDAKAGQIRLRPQDLVFTDPNFVGQEIRLTGGDVRLAGRQVDVERLSAESGPLSVLLDGSWNGDKASGEVVASWTVLSDQESNQGSGVCRAFVDSSRSGRRTAKMSVTTEARTPVGDLTAEIDVDGAGADWRQSQWRISAPRLAWTRDGRPVDLSGTAAEVRLDGPVVQLTSLRVPGVDVANARAQFNSSTYHWSANLAAEGLRQLESWGVKTLGLQVDAEGDDRTARIRDLRVTQGPRIVTARGDLHFAEWELENVRLTADWPADGTADAAPQPAHSFGQWRLEGDLAGRIQPLAVELHGRMTGRNVVVGKQTVERVTIPVRAAMNPREVHATADTVDLFDGSWLVSGRHDLSSERTEIAVTVDGLSLESVAAMAGLPRVSKGRMHAQIRLTVQDFDLGSVAAAGSWNAENIEASPWHIPRAQGGVHFSNGLARFDEIVLEQEGGRIQARAELRLDDREFIDVEVSSRRWHTPLAGDRLSLQADGTARLRLNTVKHTVDGEADLSGQMLWEGQPLARILTVALMRGQAVEVREFRAETLGGAVTGRTTIPLHDWRSSTAALSWQGLQPALLREWAPPLGRFEGVLSGSLDVGQAPPETRPPESLQFVLDARAERGSFGLGHIDSCRLVGFLGDRRLLIDEANLRILDGQLKAKTRISAHAGGHYASFALDFNDLSLDQLVRVIDPNAGEYPGSLAGSGTVLASSEGRSLGGEVRLRLTESDLVGNGVVQGLYNALNLKLGGREPIGAGEMIVRLDGSSAVIPSFVYFNRGVEIRGAGTIRDVYCGAQSPVDGFAVGSTRILREIRLPGVKALDQVLATFQTGAASVKIAGTIEKTEVKVVPLPEVLGPFRSLLWSQLRR